MQIYIPVIAGVVLALIFVGVAALASMRTVARARATGEQLLADYRHEAESEKQKIIVAAQDKALAAQEEGDNRERELDTREASLEQRAGKIKRDSADLDRRRNKAAAAEKEAERLRAAADQAAAEAQEDREKARSTLEQIAGLSPAEARAKLIEEIEEEARGEGAKVARKIEEEARERAEQDAIQIIVQACQRVDINEVAESTVSYIELPSDEMKGRIIGKEGRNIRAMEMATGIDLVVDDTPRTILISSFDPVRREIARVAIDRLVEDGRIHPARIEEVVQKAKEEIDEVIEERGNEAAYSLGISDLHPRLTRLVGRLRYHTSHGQNLLQHALETAIIAGFMADEIGARPETCLRDGLLHEIGAVDGSPSGNAVLLAADLAAKHNEKPEVVEAIRSLHADVSPKLVESLLLNTANRLSETRPGARKENLAVFIERLRRLENIATTFAGVDRAYAIKAGKEIRVIVDATQTRDEHAYSLSKKIARALEKELNYPGQIKVCVVRETRSVRFAV